MQGLNYLQDRIKAAAAQGQTLRIAGAGSKSFYDTAQHGEALEVTAHSGIISYEPTELVITARCGTPLAEIEALLAENGQALAFEPPNFNNHATFGGMVAAGLSGPDRKSVV